MSGTKMEVPGASRAALAKYLSPFAEALGDSEVTEVVTQKPGSFWVYRHGQATQHFGGDELNYENMRMLATVAAGCTGQVINEKHPLVSGSLPDGHRIQIAIPPATVQGSIAIAIRRHTSLTVTFEDYVRRGAFAYTKKATQRRVKNEQELMALYVDGSKEALERFVVLGMESRLNFLISGGTGSGKTHFQKALLTLVPRHRRIITIEDTQELALPQHQNHVHLLYSRGDQGMSDHTASDLVRASLRMRPDHIHIGELRGEGTEAASYLQAINTGHPGAVTTIHANSCEHAIDQLAHMVLLASQNLKLDEVVRYVRSIINGVIHFDAASDPPFVPVEILYISNATDDAC